MGLLPCLEVHRLGYIDNLYNNAQFVVNKYGSFNGVDNAAVDDIWSPGGAYVWQTAAESLYAVSSSTNDASGGSGAQKITVYGLDADWNLQEETVTMNGTTNVNLTKTFLRVFRARVVQRGTYTGANAGNITIARQSDDTTRAYIRYDSSFGGVGSTEMSHYTVPAGFTAHMTYYEFNIEASKPVDVYATFRTNPSDTFSGNIPGIYATPVTERSVSGELVIYPSRPFQFPEKSDLWVKAKATGATSGLVEVRYQLLLTKNTDELALVTV